MMLVFSKVVDFGKTGDLGVRMHARVHEYQVSIDDPAVHAYRSRRLEARMSLDDCQVRRAFQPLLDVHLAGCTIASLRAFTRFMSMRMGPSIATP